MSAGDQQAANIFDTFGDLHAAEQAYELAWESYTLSLRLSRPLEDRIGQLLTWINLAQLLAEQKQSAVAISFYKQAINQIEQIRDNVRSLPLETQQRYTETVAESYRELAALLLEQERVFEAQQVLDLLKIQELENYFHDVRSEQPNISEKLPYLAPERTVIEQHQILLLQGQADTDPVLSLSEFLQHPAVADALGTLGDNLDLKPDSLKQLQKKLNTLPHRTAVLYPLILEDRLELLLISAEGTPIHTTTWLAKHQLTKQVNTLRNNLSDPSSDVKAVAGSLYDAIIAPFNEDLKRLNIENIIYIPDGVLHYIPLSVLYNRVDNRWLVEDYTSHNLTASDVGDLTHSPQRPISVLAGAFTDTNRTFEKLIGQKTTNFNGLLYAGREVSRLRETLPETEVLLDSEFNRANLETQLNGQTIVHLATHAAFVPGQPENSFVLLGDGDTITLKELRHWSLPNVDLVVLSACQTGISHIEEGVEILGMGFQVQRTEARAALASLWWVDDRATSQLMELFYDELIMSNTKAQALQNAQRQLIAQGKNEPYYWAPFVLIGNGL
ncbi:MAG: CHAT domain-containing protein [Cyanobacteria bacterium P01_D01_bin.56]